jgi:protoheme IX farnesyltransferase
MKTVLTYYRLTKPGIIRGNAITAIAGFLLAAKGHIDPWVFIGMLVGISLVIASGCVFNNFLDRRIDAVMARTKKRAIPSGQVSVRAAIIYASVLGLLGIGALQVSTNPLTVFLAVFGLFAYVVLYGYAKRKTVYGTLVGSISGAIPVVVGYCAVTGRFDTGAIILFAILVVWQMPHFYAIAIYGLKDYEAAGIPVLPSVSGLRVTKIHMVSYIAAFIPVVALLSFYGITGFSYLVVTVALAVTWLVLAFRGFSAASDKAWAGQLFRFSLIVLSVFSIMISINNLLP